MPNEIMREMEVHNESWKEEHNGANHPAYQDYKDVFGGAFETVASIVLSAKVRCTNMKLEAALSMMDIDEMDIFEKFAYSRKSNAFCDRSSAYKVRRLRAYLFKQQPVLSNGQAVFLKMDLRSRYDRKHLQCSSFCMEYGR